MQWGVESEGRTLQFEVKSEMGQARPSSDFVTDRYPIREPTNHKRRPITQAMSLGGPKQTLWGSVGNARYRVGSGRIQPGAY